MAKFTLEWRQLEQDPQSSWFAHRLAYAPDVWAVQQLAEALGDRAWRREFRLLRGPLEVFTDLHQIQDWSRTEADMPGRSRQHVWRRDLERNLVADRFLDCLRKGLALATEAEVLLRAEADALLRFANSSLRRPSL